MCLRVSLKVNSNILDKSNDLKQLREQICKLDEQLDSRMQVKSSQICLLHRYASTHSLKEAFCFSVHHCVHFLFTKCPSTFIPWTFCEKKIFFSQSTNTKYFYSFVFVRVCA